MTISIRVKPNAKLETVEKIDPSHYVVSVKEPPLEGRANRAVVAALAEYFDVPRSRVTLISGYTGRQKVFEIQM